MSCASRGHTELPIAVGFGVKTAEQARSHRQEMPTAWWSARRSSTRSSDTLDGDGKPTAKTVPAVHALVREIAQGVQE